MFSRKLTTAQIAIAVAAATLASNFLGFVREMILANYFGAGMVADSYVMGISIPTTLLAAVLSAMGTAYMPILAEKFERQGEAEANLVTSRLINLSFIIVAVIYVISLIFSRQLVQLFAPGYAGEKHSLTVYYMRWAFMTLFFTAGITFCDSYLKYKGSFARQKFVAVIQNVCTIAAIIAAAKHDIRFMIIGFVIGSALNFFGQAGLAVKKGLKYTPDLHLSSAARDVLKLALPILIGGSFSELNTFIDKMLASNLAEGSVAALNYSGKLITLILTLSVGIFSTIIYPKLNQAFVREDIKRVEDLTERGINLLAVITVPFAAGAMLYSTQITRIVYERGAFEGTATALVAAAFLFYAIRIPFYGVSELLNRTFYAMHDTKTAVCCSLAAIAVNISLNLLLVGPMGVAGLALATSAAELVGMAARYMVFSRKYRNIRLLKSKKKPTLILLFSLCAIAFSYGVYSLLPVMPFVRLVIAVISAAALYLVLLAIFKFDELKLLKDLIRR